jgi:diaminopimelate epimerase
MQFVKSHGAGNDFVLIEDLEDQLGMLDSAFVALVCDRHQGVGADGLIRIAPSTEADFFMDYYNADGGVAEMCGNGIRCLAKYVADRGIIGGDELRIDTRAGIKHLVLYRNDESLVDRVRVDMGPPVLGDPLNVAVNGFEAACVSMGNPHAVIVIPTLAEIDVEHLGPAIENDAIFPAKTNVEFTEILSRDEVRVRVWERGVGETQACGTGACATAVATSLLGLTERSVKVNMPGGQLDIDWTDETTFLTGPVVEVFSGTLDEHIGRRLPAPSRR